MLTLKNVSPKWMDNSLRRLNWWHRNRSASNRALPDFIIIGAQKSGTSSLYSYVSQHPDVLSPVKKEIHFFDSGLNPDRDNYQQGENWYRARFPLSRQLGSGRITFEASPSYLFNPLVPRRIFDLLPDAKLIAVLRNPVDRAISHYFHERSRNREPLSFKEAIEQEESRLAPAIKNEDYKNSLYLQKSYRSRGLYKKQIERFLEYFPKEQILVISSEDLFTRTDETLARVFSFIGMDADFQIHNPNPKNTNRAKEEVDSDTIRHLREYFNPHNQELFELIEEDFGWNR